jgi:hypothetical protein
MRILGVTASVLKRLPVQYLVVAGGGAGGASAGAGGGGGGLLTNQTDFILNTNYTVTVGAGGSGSVGSPSNVRNDGNPGNNSVFSTITALKGGGGGGNSNEAHNVAGGNGVVGSGGGGQGLTYGPGAAGTPGQGNNGGNGFTSGGATGGGGGGGAGRAGYSSNELGLWGGSAGHGLQALWTNTSTWFAGGGAATGFTNGVPGSQGGTPVETNGAANTGAGAGGAAGTIRNGGSGIVVLRYPSGYTITTTGLTASTATVGSDKITTITGGTGNVRW